MSFAANEATRAKIIQALKEWCAKPTSLRILDFCKFYGIRYHRLNSLFKQYPDIHAAYDKARTAVKFNRQRVDIINTRK